MDKTQNVIHYWQQIQECLKEQVGQNSYETWLKSIQAKSNQDDSLTLEVPDSFFQTWIIDHYLDIIQNKLNEISGQEINIGFTINPDIVKKQALMPDRKAHISNFQSDFQLNPKYTFDNFVVGSSNRFAHAAALAVSESPAKAYNPFFIYGSAGLGKTHLMQAVCHTVIKNKKDSKICYITSEKFTNELIDAIQHRSTQKFRQKYRSVDVLLIDDIHFIAGKESTQEEFFHTFNALYDSHKQIIVSSDRTPKDIPNLEERLVSRFSWGLITDIQPPNLETRVAILKKKIEKEPYNIPDDAIFFIAQLIKTNIRELEGALIRVVAYSLMEKRPLSLELAQDVLKDMTKLDNKTITVELIQKEVAVFFGLTLQELKTGRRNKNIVLPRQVAMYLSRELTNYSLPEIGGFFGGKDHTTILYAYNKIKNQLNNDQILKLKIEQVTQQIKQ